METLRLRWQPVSLVRAIIFHLTSSSRSFAATVYGLKLTVKFGLKYWTRHKVFLRESLSDAFVYGTTRSPRNDN
ncbi:hypothetical protein F5051DRAFT_97820 [Lentinula edodes]|nr:hypothetical protein F5051DRAFT_97820 [Lentinula edodes]